MGTCCLQYLAGGGGGYNSPTTSSTSIQWTRKLLLLLLMMDCINLSARLYVYPQPTSSSWSSSLGTDDDGPRLGPPDIVANMTHAIIIITGSIRETDVVCIMLIYFSVKAKNHVVVVVVVLSLLLWLCRCICLLLCPHIQQ